MNKQTKLTPVQQDIVNALKSNKRLTGVDHTSIGVFAGKLYNATLSSFEGTVHTATLRALIAKGVLKEKHRTIWHNSVENHWTMYKVEYELAQ